MEPASVEKIVEIDSHIGNSTIFTASLWSMRILASESILIIKWTPS